MSGWVESLSAEVARHPGRRRSCIVLWMDGGPSQLDTFDPKPGHANGGPYKAIQTTVPGVVLSEHLPKLATHLDDLALIRSMQTKEGDHGRANYTLHTGRLPRGTLRYPTLGSLVSKEAGDDQADLPAFVSILPNREMNADSCSPGFLGPRYAPLIVGGNYRAFSQQDDETAQTVEPFVVENLQSPSELTRGQVEARRNLLDRLESDFVARHPGPLSSGHRTAYERAIRMMQSEATTLFRLENESAELRDAYGRNLFGQGCLLARRLVERGVPFVEVTLGGVEGFGTLGWDTHSDNFETVKQLSAVLDTAWSALIDDLRSRGLLESTLIVWMGEFGRTPTINRSAGRDHYPAAWSTVLAGGGIRGGQVVGKTNDGGTEVLDRPVTVPDLLATILRALTLDPMTENLSDLDRPIRLVDADARPIEEVLG